VRASDLRELTDKPFGVNLILSRPAEERVRVCLEERVPLLSLFWGDPSPYVPRAHELGIKVCIQVGSVAAAEHAAAAGVNFVIAQGTEAGGHTHGEISTMALVPRVVDAVAPGQLPQPAASRTRGRWQHWRSAQMVRLGTAFGHARSQRAPAVQTAHHRGRRRGHCAHHAVRRWVARCATRVLRTTFVDQC
jgi:hypothetical protein